MQLLALLSLLLDLALVLVLVASPLAIVIALPDEPQAIQRQHFIHARDVLAVRRDQLRESARSDNFRLRSKFLNQALENPIDEANVTVVQTDLDVVGRTCADDLCRLLDLDARKACGARKECV